MAVGCAVGGASAGQWVAEKNRRGLEVGLRGSCSHLQVGSSGL